jgi:hypothetical protein
MGDLGKHQAFFDALRAALTKPSSPVQNIDQFDREFDMALSRELRPADPVSISPARRAPLPEDVEPTIPDLLPDEIIHGWRGRVAALNALSKIRQVEPLLRLCAEKSATELSDDPDFIECAAAALGVTRQELLRRHTLPPFFDALGELKQNKPGTKSAKHLRAYLRQAPFRTDGKEALFCRQCAEEDVAFWKFSYWRRSHHLPGVQCCSKHGSLLLSAGTHEAFDRCPHHFLGAQLKECAMPHDELVRQILLRYSQIAADILDCAPSIDSTAASIKLGQRATAAGLRISNPGRRKTPSTYVMELLPVDWLQKTFPRVHWETGKFISTFDGACSPRATRYTTATLCLLAAVLYDDAEQAAAELLGRSDSVEQRESLGFDFWASREVLDLYVACGGVVSKVAEKLGLPTSSVSIGLLNQGLPGLGKSAGPRKALKLFYAGDTLGEACRKVNISRDLVENLLRAGGGRLAMALEMMPEEEPELI